MMRTSGGRTRAGLGALALVMLMAYVSVVIMPSTTTTAVGTPDVALPTQRLTPAPYDENALEPNAQPLATSSPRSRQSEEEVDAAPPKKVLEAWGYNANRNRPRWEAIRKELLADHPNPNTAEFALVDYGADQGYFTVSTAHLFPRSLVIAIEMGGKGGEIWKKDGQQDVLTIIEGHLTKNKAGKNVVICQTKAQTTQFSQINENGLLHTYQYVLSVFHWFDLKTRDAFEVAITDLFRNARTTFIELPTAGDGSALIRKQVGWDNFKRWYDGRSDLGEVMSAAARNKGLEVRVKMIASLPWLKWTRDVFRVDVVVSEDAAAAERRKINCPLHLKIYDCTPRAKHSQCPGSWSLV
eukprot:PhM_4_TR12977/c0_g1_i1/m.63570